LEFFLLEKSNEFGGFSKLNCEGEKPKEVARKTAQSSDSYRCFLPDLAGLAAAAFATP